MEVPPSVPSMSSPGTMYSKQQMAGIETPHENDVLCGRGVTTNRHVGNENFRSLVNCNKEIYVTSTKRQKMTISRSIVEAVRSLEPPGRFLEKDQSTGSWFDIGDKKAIEKTSQALRDGAANLRKQLSMDLNDPDFLSAVFDVDNDMVKKGGDPSNKSSNKARPTKGKQLPSKQNHRRTKSNPPSGHEKPKGVKTHVKKQRSLQLDPPTPKSSSQTAFSGNSSMGQRHPMSGGMPQQQGTRSVPSSPNFVRSSYAETPPPESRPFRHGKFTFVTKAGNKILGVNGSFEQQNNPRSPVNVTPSSSAAGYSTSSSMHDGPGPQLPPMSPGRGDDDYGHPPASRPPISYKMASSFQHPERRGHCPSPHRSPRHQEHQHHPMSPPPPGPLQPGIHRLSPAGYQKADNSPMAMQWSPRRTPNSPRNTGPIHTSPCHSMPSRSTHPYHHPNHDNGNHRPPPQEFSNRNYQSDYSNYPPPQRYAPDFRPPLSPRYSDQGYEEDYGETASTGNLSVPMLNNCEGGRLPMSPPSRSSGYYPLSPHSTCSAPPHCMHGPPPPSSPCGPPMPAPPSPRYQSSSVGGSRSPFYLPPPSARFRQSRPPPLHAPSEFLPPPSESGHRRHNNTDRVMTASPSSGREPNFASPPPLYPRKSPRTKEVQDLDSSPGSRHEDIEEKKSEDADDSRSDSIRTQPPKCTSSSSPSGVVDSVEVVLTTNEGDDNSKMALAISRSESPRQGLLDDFMNADNPADDGMSVSPLPFEGERVNYDEEDPNSLLEVPENIMTLPISPCSPNDES